MTYPSYVYEGCDVTIKTEQSLTGKWQGYATIENKLIRVVQETISPLEFDTEQEAFAEA